MNLRIPPPLVMMVFGGFMYLPYRFLPIGQFDFFSREVIIYFILAIGFFITAIALFQFKRAGTTTNPIHLEKADRLVTSGIFLYSRNPMYLALLIFLIAFSLHLGNGFNIIFIVGFVSYINHFQIKREEVVLAKKFGEKYLSYLKTVRRWL